MSFFEHPFPFLPKLLPFFFLLIFDTNSQKLLLDKNLNHWLIFISIWYVQKFRCIALNSLRSLERTNAQKNVIRFNAKLQTRHHWTMASQMQLNILFDGKYVQSSKTPFSQPDHIILSIRSAIPSSECSVMCAACLRDSIPEMDGKKYIHTSKHKCSLSVSQRASKLTNSLVQYTQEPSAWHAPAVAASASMCRFLGFDEFDVALTWCVLFFVIIIVVVGSVSGGGDTNTWLKRRFWAGFRVNYEKQCYR